MKILLVDDDDLSLDAMEFWLKIYFKDHNVRANKYSFQAEELLQQEHFDVLITDWRMPYKSGTQLAIKAKDAHPDIVVILYSGDPPKEKPKAVDHVLARQDMPDALRDVLVVLIDDFERRK